MGWAVPHFRLRQLRLKIFCPCFFPSHLGVWRRPYVLFCCCLFLLWLSKSALRGSIHELLCMELFLMFCDIHCFLLLRIWDLKMTRRWHPGWKETKKKAKKFQKEKEKETKLENKKKQQREGPSLVFLLW